MNSHNNCHRNYMNGGDISTNRHVEIDRIVSMIPESLSCILDSKTHDSGFHQKNFSGFWTPQTKPPEFWNLESLTWGE